MSARETGTEQLIKETAKRVFFAEGRLHASTQDIADAAGISRTSLHYYFRSRDELMRQVFEEAMHHLDDKLYAVMDAKISFATKLEKMIDIFLGEMIEFPHTETFLVTQMIANNQNVFKLAENGNSHIKSFMKEVEKEMKAGRITKMDPVQYVMNMFSLTSHPLVISPLHKKMFGLTDAGFEKLMKARKKVILDILLR